MGRYLLAVMFVILFLGANHFMAYRASTMEERIDQYDTIVLGQAAVQPGAPQALRVVARHVGTDKPRPDEAVKVYIAPMDKPREKKLMFEGKTNTEGSSAPKFVAPEEEGTYTLIIESGADTHEATLTVKRKAKVLLSTDKPLYQPGQLVHVRALALSSIDAKPLAATNATFELEDPKGNKVYRKVVTTSEYGIASVSIALAPELILGRYRVSVTAGGVNSQKSIRVERYVLPKFRVALETDRSFYKPNDKLDGTITARYFFGKPVSKSEAEVVFYTVDVGERELHSWKGTTDEMGQVKFTYTLPSAFHGTDLEKGRALLFLNVSVTDRGDHAEEIVRQFPISISDIVIDLIPESGHLNFNFANVMYVATSTPDGVPAPATVEVSGDTGFTTTIKTGNLGLGSFEFKPQNNNPQLILEAKDAEGRTGSKKWYYREGRERRDYELERSSILVRTDRGMYRVGDTATVTVLHSGASPAAYVDLVKDGQTVDARSLTLKEGQGEAVFDIDASMAGQLIVHAYHTTRRTSVERATRRIVVLPADQLAVSVGTDRESYKPGELARLSVSTERKGEGIPAAVGLTIVDESVFALEEAKAGFERMAFYLGRELAKPRFTVYGFNPMAPERPTPAPAAVKVEEDIHIAEQVFLARNAPGAKIGEFGIQVSTREEKEAQVQEAKESFFRNQSRVLALVCLLAGLASVAAFVRGTEDGRWAAVKDLVKGVVLVGLVFGALVAFVYMIEWVDDGIRDVSWRDREAPQGVLLLTFFLISVILWRLQHVRAAGFHARFIAGILFPIAVLGVMVAGTMVRSPIVIIACVAVLMVYVLRSLFTLYNAAVTDTVLAGVKNHLFALLVFMMVIIAMPFIFSYTRTSVIDEEVTGMLFLLASGMLMLPFTGLAARHMRQRTKLALPMLVSAFGIALPLLIISFFMMAMPVMRSVNMGMQDEVSDTMRERILNDIKSAPEKQIMTSFSTGKGEMEVDFMEDDSGGASEEEGPRVRAFFPETLYVNPQVITDAQGKADIYVPLADSITTWKVGAMANAMSGELGSTEAGILVFQDFFVDIDFPVFLTQNDTVSVPLTVYNYLDAEQEVRLVVEEDPDDRWFTLQDRLLPLSPPSKREIIITLDANDITSAHLSLRADTIGKHNLTVFAYGTGSSDAVRREVEILPNGREFRTSTSERLKEGTVTIPLTVPTDAIPDSYKAMLKLHPGVMSQIVEGLDAMLKMPTGCFEQTSSTTYPNIMVLQYLRETKQANPELELKAENFIGVGYQRLLSFETSTPGGFDWFGNPPAKLLLTAMGLQQFSDMAKVYEVDPAVIDRTQRYLLSEQESDGSWEPQGAMFEMSKRQKSMIGTTCYLTWSLLESGLDRDHMAFSKALGYIRKNIDPATDDMYTIALCLSAMVEYDASDSLTIQLLDQAVDRATVKDGMAWWASKNMDEPRGFTGSGGTTKSLEDSAMIALALIEAEHSPQLVTKALAFITSQKDSFGKWGSTYATVLSLKALMGSSLKAKSNADATITVKIDGVEVRTLRVTRENADIMHLVSLGDDLAPGAHTVELVTEGGGLLHYQVVGSYYLPWSHPTVVTERSTQDMVGFSLKYDRTELATNDMVTADVKVWNNGAGVAPFVVADMGIPPGFAVVAEDLEELKQRGVISRYSVKPRQAILYIENLDKEGLKFTYRLVALYPVKATAPRSIVYDYYRPDAKTEAPPVDMVITG